jgi:hypothetical protein
VLFWKYKYPRGNFEINLKNTKTGFWTYTGYSAACGGDRPYSRWIHETFRPSMQPTSETYKYVSLVRDLVFENGVPVAIRFDIAESDDNQNWRTLDLDNDKWQKDKNP